MRIVRAFLLFALPALLAVSAAVQGRATESAPVAPAVRLGSSISQDASGSRPAVRPASGERVRTCFSAAQTRERIAAGGLADPFGLMRAKARELRAEAISVKLCETGGALVYQIDFLRPDGRLVHALFEAATGKAWVARDLGARPEK